MRGSSNIDPHHMITLLQLECLCLTETWDLNSTLQTPDMDVFILMAPPAPRRPRRGGGVALLTQKYLKAKVIFTLTKEDAHN